MSRFSILAAVVALVAAACASTGADTAQDAATTTAAPVTTTAPAPETTVTTEAETGHDEEGEAGHDDDSSDADRMVEIIMTEFSFDVNPLAVTAGETIEFVVTNAGVVEHAAAMTTTTTAMASRMTAAITKVTQMLFSFSTPAIPAPSL